MESGLVISYPLGGGQGEGYRSPKSTASHHWISKSKGQILCTPLNSHGPEGDVIQVGQMVPSAVPPGLPQKKGKALLLNRGK